MAEKTKQFSASIVPPREFWPKLAALRSQCGCENKEPAIQVLTSDNPLDKDVLTEALRTHSTFRVKLDSIRCDANGALTVDASASDDGFVNLRKLVEKLLVQADADDCKTQLEPLDSTFGIPIGKGDGSVATALNTEWDTLEFEAKDLVVNCYASDVGVATTYTLPIGYEVDLFEDLKQSTGVVGVLVAPKETNPEYYRLEIKGRFEEGSKQDEAEEEAQQRLIYIVADRSGSMGWDAGLGQKPCDVIVESLLEFYDELKEMKNVKVKLLPFDSQAYVVDFCDADNSNAEWNCPSCTFLNPGHSARCEVCNARKPAELSDAKGMIRSFLRTHLQPRGGTDFKTAAQVLADSAGEMFSQGRRIRLHSDEKSIKKDELQAPFVEKGLIGGRPSFVQDDLTGYAVWFHKEDCDQFGEWVLTSKKHIRRREKAVLVARDNAHFPWKVTKPWVRPREESWSKVVKSQKPEKQVPLAITLEESRGVDSVPALGLIFISDGQTSNQNAKAAHLIWKNFAQGYTENTGGMVPRVECIGLTDGHSADILDGFIVDDSFGQYTNCGTKDEIIDSMRTGFDEVSKGEGKQFTLELPCMAKTNVIQDSQEEFTAIAQDGAINQTLWIHRDAKDTLLNKGFKLNGAPATIRCKTVTGASSSVELLELYKSKLTGMTSTLRALTDKSSLEAKAKEYQKELTKLTDDITVASMGPPSLLKVRDQLRELLAGKDVSNAAKRRAELMKAYRTIGGGESSAKLQKLGQEAQAILQKLSKVVKSVLVGERLEEIRRHIVDLHYKAKHTKTVERLMMTEAQLLSREQRQNAAKPPSEEDIKDLTDEDGSGCYLSTLTLREVAGEGEILWVVGRISRKGGAAASNTELLNIEYVSPFFVSEEYFRMALEVSPEGFVDGSQELINARLFPVWGNWAHFVSTRAFLDEGLAHTVFGRGDIRLPEFHLLWAVVGHLVETVPHTEKFLHILKELCVPSLRYFAEWFTTYPFTRVNSHGEKAISRAPVLTEEKIKYLEYSRQRLEIFLADPAARTTSLVTRPRTLYADALLSGVDVSGSEFWASVLLGRLRAISKSLIWFDPDTRREDKDVLHTALRVLVMGAEDTPMKPTKEEYLKLECEARDARKEDRKLSNFRDLKGKLPVVFTVDPDTIQFSSDVVTPSMLQVVAELSARVNVTALDRSRRLLGEVQANPEIEVGCLATALSEANPPVCQNMIEFATTVLDGKLSLQGLRALVGLSLCTVANGEYLSHMDLATKIFTNPESVLNRLFAIVRGRLASDWEKNKSKLRQENVKRQQQKLSKINHSLAKVNGSLAEDLRSGSSKLTDETRRVFGVSFCGGHDSGKSTMMAQLLLECGQILPRSMEKLRTQAAAHGQQSQGLRWAMDKHIHERINGRTMSTRDKQRLFTTAAREYCLKDLSTQATLSAKRIWSSSFCVMVVPATSEFELQWKAIKMQCKTLGGFGFSSKRMICAVNKMDQVELAKREDRFEEVRNEMKRLLKSATEKADNIQFIPVSAHLGWNLSVKTPEHMPWYGGCTLSDALDGLPASSVKADEPDRIVVDQRWKVPGVGQVAGGITLTGKAAPGKVYYTHGKAFKIKSIEKWWKQQNLTGVNAPVGVKFTSPLPEDRNLVLCEDPQDKLTRRCRKATVMLHYTSRSQVKAGTQLYAFVGCMSTRVKVLRLVSKLNPKTMEVVEVDPVEFGKNDLGMVEIELVNPFPLVAWSDAKTKTEKRFAKLVIYTPSNEKTCKHVYSGVARVEGILEASRD